MKKLLPLCIVVCLVGNTSTGAITATVPSQLGNISTRGFVQTGNDVMIGGFIIQGTTPKTVIVRAIGPELTPPPYNIPNALADPNLQLFNGTGTLIAQNNNWQTTEIGGIITRDQVSAIQNSGHAPTQASESAIVVTLPPGNYTAIVSGVNNTIGVALVEVYDLSPATNSLLGNISTRDFVQTGDNVMIGGFIIKGTTPKTVIVRAIGPELTPPPYNIPNALADPTLELHDGTGALIASNDNWQTTIIGGIITGDQVSAIQNSGHAPTQASESAIIATLPPGNYTAIVGGANNTTGVALVEVYYLDSAPIPLTPLTLATNGIDPTSPVSVSFYNSAGFSFSDPPIRVEADGTVVVAVPLYVDPGTNAITSGTVSMILTQGSNSSPPISLDIQNLPTLDTYGTQLGEISHALLIMDATLLGRRVNQLQAAQLLFSGVDTSAAQSTASTLLNGAVRARNDVDRVMLDHSTVIAGTLTNGAPIQFDQHSQDMMDRVIAVYLTQLASVTANSSGADRTLAGRSEARQGGAALRPNSLDTFITSMKTLSGIVDIEKASQDSQNTNNTTTDTALAVAKGANSYLGLAAIALENGTLEQDAGALGIVFGLHDVVTHASDMVGDLGNLLTASASGGDPALFQRALDNVRTASIPLAFDLAQTGLASYLLFLTPAAPAEAAIVSVQFALTCLQIYSETQEGKMAFETALGVAEEVPQFSSPNQGFGQIDGMADISNTLGIAASQTSLDLCCMGPSGSDIQGIADPSGNYDLFVPLEVPNTSYNNLTLSAFDFITGRGTTLGSETVDLSGLDTSQPVQVPTIIGTCNDTDAGNPDGDDPDCD